MNGRRALVLALFVANSASILPAAPASAVVTADETPNASPEQSPPASPQPPAEASPGREQLTALPVGSERYTPFSRDVPDSNGGRALEVYAGLEFFQDDAGRWDRFDLALEPSADGRELKPKKAGREAARLARRLERETLRVSTALGDVEVRHMGAAPADAVVEDGATARYRGALGKGRDLLVRVTAGGFRGLRGAA